MSADFAVFCRGEDGEFTEEYSRILLLAHVAIVCYPVCMPCVYACLLFKARHAVWSESPTRLSASVNFLTGEYAKAYYFWELVEVLKKLLLVRICVLRM